MSEVWVMGIVAAPTGAVIGALVMSAVRSVWERQRSEELIRDLIQREYELKRQIIEAMGIDPEEMEAIADALEYERDHEGCEYLVDDEGLFHHHCIAGL